MLPGDTIFAPSTGSGKGAIAVIRISGPEAHAAIRKVTRRAVPQMRRACLRAIRDSSGDMLDQAIVIAFADDESFTGEKMAEIHCHGSRAVLTSLCTLLAGSADCRMAMPGEFTRRAFQNGRMDLSEVEGLGDLIAAETEAQRQQAVRLMSGALSNVAEDWRSGLLKARALLEATIDWADEDVPQDVLPEVCVILNDLVGSFDQELQRSDRAERIRTGFEVAIIGAPNVGKSSLLNALAGREAAIISDVPGTTRDVIEVIYDLDGLRVTFLDTAGLRETADAVEAIGVAQAYRRAEGADLRVFLNSLDAPLPASSCRLYSAEDICVWSKCDLAAGQGELEICAKTGKGVSELLDAVRDRLAGQSEQIGLLSHARHCAVVEDARAAVVKAHAHIESGATEVVAEELRLACVSLDALTGRVGTEDMLDVVFRSFCLGK